MTIGSSHIAELCAELVQYGILIKIDHLLTHQTNEMSRKEMEAALWQFLQTLHASSALRSVNASIQTLDRMYVCLGCKYTTIFKLESEEHARATGHKASSIPFASEWER